MKSVLKALTSFCLVAVMGLSSTAQAGIDSNGWVGGLLGIHIPDAEDTTARLGWGVTAGAKLGTEWGFGAYYLNSGKEESSNGIKFDFDYTMYGVEAGYHFEGEAAGVYVGGRLGMTRVDSRILGVDIDFQPFHFGFMAGYNHWLTEQISIGGEASYMNVASDKDTVSGATLELESFNIIAFMASVKFWF